MASNNRFSKNPLFKVDKCIENRMKSIRKNYLTNKELDLLRHLHSRLIKIDI